MIVKNDITDRQVRQLIKFANTDDLVRKFTSDSERFKNRTAYAKWKKGKVIYTLTDKTGNLLGIIWFGKRKNSLVPGHDFTFAIRIYPPARGKGLAFGFMKKAFAGFKHKKIWVATHRDNLAAIALYKKFGFKEIASKDGRLIMILI